MSGQGNASAGPDGYERAYDLFEPAAGQQVPIVIASPHSGRYYSPAFLAQTRLDPLSLRRSEDSFVDTIFGFAPEAGMPLLAAGFPRAYLDVNREPFELDPAMFQEPLPGYVNSRSPRVAAGLGTVPRVVANGEEIYAGPLPFAQAQARIQGLYHPYHRALTELVAATHRRFGACLLIDAHSMPSQRGVGGLGRPFTHGARGTSDIVLGDYYGNACSPELVGAADSCLRDLGYAVSRNTPYAGGYTTRHYGRPAQGVHALQVEIDRRLYMDEAAVTPKPGLDQLSADMARLVAALAAELSGERRTAAE